MSVTERVIYEQFPFWRKAIELELPPLPAKTLVFVGCGTSYYLSQSLAAAFNLAGRPAVAVPGAEWIFNRRAYVGERTDVCVVGLSRSGESTETVRAIRESVAAGIDTVAITCAADSAIAKAADQTIFAATHAEEGIVMTSSASLMLLVGLRWAGVSVAEATVAAAEQALREMAAKAPGIIEGRSHFVFLGGGALYGLASEGALKLQEMSITYSQAFHPLEYRHGPISLVDDRTLVVLLYGEETREAEERVARDVQSKGARVIGFGGAGDLSLPIGESGLGRMLIMLPALQLLGEEVARAKSIDTTQPRHLTKVVTLS
ncbi:SIS domain-containing protein [Consotaella salsifontis]|uniref:Glucosamine--fructose-6-phosphate aminotransferase (Isomerizing) n=1 Tax=Consotaella salsifontis TaxID=1365950 RepID=A0A1T4RNI1_9HYPH|nr:SIS domain-containing protein [Consotaella salsifontis]SKA17575.1 glucosamine--fructose-6-phosphate aminotransferase (isomerizing) [Consotaella salsifontis]